MAQLKYDEDQIHFSVSNKSSSCEINIPTYTKGNEDNFWDKSLNWNTNPKCPWKNTFDQFKNESSVFQYYVPPSVAFLAILRLREQGNI